MFRITTKKKQLECQDIQVLTQSQYEKLECGALQGAINVICNDLHIEGRYVEETDNQKMSVITKTTESFDNQTAHEWEMTHLNFLSAIDELVLPELLPHRQEEEEQSPQTANVGVNKIEFVKQLLHDLDLPENDDEHAVGALVIDMTTCMFCPELTGWGRISHDLLKEFCELWLKAHS